MQSLSHATNTIGGVLRDMVRQEGVLRLVNKSIYIFFLDIFFMRVTSRAVRYYYCCLMQIKLIEIAACYFYRPLRGASAVVIGAGPAHALYFSSYEFTKASLAKMKINDNVNYREYFFKKNPPLAFLTKLSLIAVISATSATLIHDAISNPTEVIKQRLQMYDSPYKSVMECAKKVFRQEGFSAFYRSYTTQLVMNLPYQAIHFSTYEFFQETVSRQFALRISRFDMKF
jgi:hypothetical protein